MSNSKSKKAAARALEEKKREKRNKIIFAVIMGLVLIGVTVTVILLVGGDGETERESISIESVEKRLDTLVKSGDIVVYSRLDEIELDSIAKSMGYDGKIVAGITARKGEASLNIIDFGSETVAEEQLEPLRASLVTGTSSKRVGGLIYYGDATLVSLATL